MSAADAEPAARPFCSEASLAAGEPASATASRIEHWLLIEYGGYWPYEPLDAAVFAGTLREHLAAQLERLPRSRLLLVKGQERARGGRVRVVYGATPERGRRFFSLEVDGHPDLLELDVASALLGASPHIGEPLDHPLLLVCTHGVRDRCCARYGQLLCRAANRQAPPGWAWQSSHVGGDRFAGNLVTFPEGLYFGRLDGRAFTRVLDAYVDGRIDLEHYRGAPCYAMPVQAAELRVRHDTGLTGFYDLALRSSVREQSGAWQVRFAAEVAGDVHEVEVVEERAEVEIFLTCRAERPRRARRYVARSSRVVS